MFLPPFDPPKYDELRAWWLVYQTDDVRRLILEVQSQRYFLSELRALAEGCRIATENDRPLDARMRQISQLLRQIDAELRRSDRIYRDPPTSHPNAPKFRR
jgi:hypothetical protein